MNGESTPSGAPLTLAGFYAARLDEAEARAKRGNKGWEPFESRALREVAAHRAILAAWQEAAAKKTENEIRYGIRDGRADALRGAVRHLAAVYSDHPDYRSEWKP